MGKEVYEHGPQNAPTIVNAKENGGTTVKTYAASAVSATASSASSAFGWLSSYASQAKDNMTNLAESMANVQLDNMNGPSDFMPPA